MIQTISVVATPRNNENWIIYSQNHLAGFPRASTSQFFGLNKTAIQDVPNQPTIMRWKYDK